MKKLICTMLIICSMLTLSACGNMSIMAECYYDYAIVAYPNGAMQTIYIKDWREYNENMIQLTDEDGKVYLFHSNDVVLIKEPR